MSSGIWATKASSSVQSTVLRIQIATKAQAQAAWGFVNRSVETGYSASFASGRVGRGVRSPPQLGQTPPNRFSTQSAQNVHSKVQIRAAGSPFGRSRSQHSQLGRIASIFGST